MARTGARQGDVRIRTATPADFDSLIRMTSRLVQRAPQQYARGWASSGDARALVMSLVEKGCVIVAHCQDEVIGHIGWRWSMGRPEQAGHKYCEIESVYVHPKFRQNDVGTRLGRACVRECERRGYDHIEVNAFTDPASVALFESLGFVQTRCVLSVVPPRAAPLQAQSDQPDAA